ncbi:Adenylate isopentenyltransferase 5, chloroplastic [Ananas comosus]|uniref:adenylate dimethylallyltransferase (ADP/ATP-dependent) n=1 Tax=Ananas comosus TaxID=4615 RepID=A0A199V3Q8_ANACO|nr:Adenylate isopentenyltransferase 5, chloroplastic [Ananas comosus]
MALLLFFSQQISSPRLLRDAIAPAPLMDAENSLLPPHRKDKVVFVLGATATGKSKLAIALAIHFDGEVVNSDKMQVYSGLDVITNKVTQAEAADIPHHLLGGVHPDADFTAADFRREAALAVASIVARGRLPIVAGGSNSYIEALVDGEAGEFRRHYDCCYLWVDVDLPVLHKFAAARVDKMVQQGLIDEARSVFNPNNGDYTRGVRRSIGVPELDRYFRVEAEAAADEETLERLRAAAIDEIKVNTCKLTVCQLLKIHRFCRLEGWDVSRIDATEFFLKRGAASEEEEEVWEKIVGIPSTNIVRAFLERDDYRDNNDNINDNNKSNNNINNNNNNNCTVLHGNRDLEKDENTKKVIINGGDQNNSTDDHENVYYYVGDKNIAVEVMVEKAVLAAAAAAAAADEVSDDAKTAAAAAVTAAATATAAGATTV